MKHLAARILAIGLAAAPAHGMEFSVSKTPRGNTYISASGDIDEASASQLRALIARYGLQGGIIALNSPGGSVIGGLALGREIRAESSSTIVLPGAECVSACAFAFVGGTDRIVTDGGTLGVHQFRFEHGADSNTATNSAQIMSAELLDYFDEMGVNSAVLALGMRTSPDKMYDLSPAEMARYRVTYQRPKDSAQNQGFTCLPQGWEDPLGLYESLPRCSK